LLTMLFLAAEILYRDDDSRLVHEALSGNKEAFSELVRKYEKLVYNTSVQLTGSCDDAYDVSQEAFIKAYRSLGSFRGDSKFSTWLYKITYNAAQDYLRNRSRHSTVSLTVSDDDEEDNQLDITDNTVSYSPEDSYERDEQCKAVREAIMHLSEKHRQIIMLRDIEGYTYEEISEMLDIGIGTVKSRLNRARIAVKEFLIKRNFI